MRLVAHRDLVAERGLHLPLRRPLGIGLDRNLDLVDDGADLGPRFPQAACRSRGRSARRIRSPSCARRWRSGAPPRSDRRGNARPMPARPRARRRLRPPHRRSRPTRLRSPVAGSVETSVAPTRAPSTDIRPVVNLAGASCSIASPIRRMALTLLSNGCQSSRSAIADQIASTSSICIEQGAASDQ